MLWTPIHSDRALHASVLIVIVRGGTLLGPTSRSMAGRACEVDALRGDLPEGGRGEGDEGSCGFGSYIGGTPGRGGDFVNEPSYHYSVGCGSHTD